LTAVRVSFAVVLLLLSVACGRDETVRMTESTPSQSSTAAGGPENSPPASTTGVIGAEKDEPASSPTAASPTQEVHLIEYAVHIPATLPAGRVAFNIENGGKEEHAFVIAGNGIEEKSDPLTRGNTTSLEVELRPGTYTVWCPIKDHAQKGMKTTITVK
jgi:plastocyanin